MRPLNANAPAAFPVAPLPPRGPGRRVPFSMPIDAGRTHSRQRSGNAALPTVESVR